jgi:polyphenol oxidase
VTLSLPVPFQAAGEHIAIELGAATALFTTRRGGVSDGPYTSLNLGLMTEDRPDAVRANRARVVEQMGAPLSIIRQVHGTTIHRVDTLHSDPAQAPEADGQVSLLPGVAQMVLTADCLPVALGGERAVAILHCGWRGLASGIIDAGARALRELGGDGDLHAAIGPGAGGCCYEVGEEVQAEFSHYGDAARQGRNLNLKAVARSQLEQAGVSAVHDVDLCTICADPTLFFSHRREHGVTGRQAGIAWLS